MLRLARSFTTESCSILPKDSLPIGYLSLSGLIPYKAGLDIQQHLVKRRHAVNRGQSTDDPKDIICFLQHKPTYTSGRRIRNKTVEDEEKRLRDLGAEYFETMRGGQITFHGPGQLIAYPIIDIRDYNASLNVRCFVSRLEKTVIAACAEYGIQANTTENTGVWVGQEDKIAALGVHLQRYVSSHGLALNCDVDLTWFGHIVPCGLADKRVTSISRERGCITNVENALPKLIKSFEKTFHKPLVPLAQDSRLMIEIQEIIDKNQQQS
ncbi:hypothetical protein J3Q64DRAFT_1641355 [Phycomyces blakesleeanus]|uniref:lipoyl(octanoyl) transferase n=1 Tax=Phycomyces blakesleeanus TaxID=4837 RepID=A0ABR3AY66_PHYBL